MARQRQYWVVSPNVDGTGNKVEEWKKEILRHSAAIMGWRPKDPIGRRFEEDIKIDDIILIARGKKSVDITCLGVVKRKSKPKHFPTILEDPVYVRLLDPFIPLKQVPQEIPLIDVLQHTIALRKLHPEKDHTHKEVCEWMERRLRLKEQESDADTTTEGGLPKSNTYGYEVRTPERVTEFRKREKELLDDYERWLKKQGRHLSALKYGRIECDAWEQKRQNLIEAKGSTRREDIRMAVGQLFDYDFQGKEKFKQPHKAILLPEEPTPDFVEWLEPLDIKVIWRSGQYFVDNANGQFI